MVSAAVGSSVETAAGVGAVFGAAAADIVVVVVAVAAVVVGAVTNDAVP